MPIEKDYTITAEDVQNWQPLHAVLNKLLDANRELEGRVKTLETVAGMSGDVDTKELESEEGDAPAEHTQPAD